MDRIRELRLENGLTQKDLAAAVNTTNKVIWTYENGIAKPNIEILQKMAEYFACSIDYLLGRENESGVIETKGKELSAREKECLENFSSLSVEGKQRVLGYIDAIKEEEGK